MINIDTHFFLEARHVDFMTTIKERSWFANATNHDAFRAVSNLLWSHLERKTSRQKVASVLSGGPSQAKCMYPDWLLPEELDEL